MDLKIYFQFFCRRTHFPCWFGTLQNGFFKADSSEDIRWSFIDLFVVHFVGYLLCWVLIAWAYATELVSNK